ncbi:MAG: DUF4829 domain-containing protein [Coprobacillus sp.]
MKKKILLVCFLFFVLISFKSYNRKVVDVEIGQSSIFSKEEINNAVETVKNQFSFDGAALTKIWYDQEKDYHLSESYLTNGKGSTNNSKKENTIVLLSNFDVGFFGVSPALNANSTYSDYQWVLIRDSQTDSWRIDDSGY